MASSCARCALLERRFLEERRLRQSAENNMQRMRLELLDLTEGRVELGQEGQNRPIILGGADGIIVRDHGRTKLSNQKPVIGVGSSSRKVEPENKDRLTKSEGPRQEEDQKPRNYPYIGLSNSEEDLVGGKLLDDRKIHENKQQTQAEDLLVQHGNHKTILAGLKGELDAAKRRETFAQEKAAQLYREKDELEPLLRIGTMVRLRFLEQARETLFTVPRIRLNQSLIIEGNAAAHNGNGKADSALFTHNLVKPSLKSRLSGVFTSLYYSDPTAYGAWSKHMLEAINHEVTIKMLRTVNDGMNRPLTERLWALEHIECIRQNFQKNDRVEFETDGDVVRRLKMVQELVETIVSVDMRNGKASNKGKSNSQARANYESDRNETSTGRRGGRKEKEGG